jgi:hypothetical protein
VLTPAQIARDAELVPKATAFLAAFANGGALVTKSGAVVFTSLRDGLPQDRVTIMGGSYGGYMSCSRSLASRSSGARVSTSPE